MRFREWLCDVLIVRPQEARLRRGRQIVYSAALRSNDPNVCICPDPCGQRPCNTRASATTDLRVLKELNAEVSRGIKEGWLRGEAADRALDAAEGRLITILDAETTRAKRAMELAESNPELTFDEIYKQVWG